MNINTTAKNERENTPDLSAERTLYAQELIYDGAAEQGIELDHVLPDYYPEIFRILKCIITPSISSESLSPEGKLTLDGSAGIKVLYLAENSSAIWCVDQRYTFSKSIDLGQRGANSCVTVTPKADYCTCRATSPRRIDVRGAISLRVRAFAQTQCVLPEIPQEMQVKTKALCAGDASAAGAVLGAGSACGTGAVCGKTLCAEKHFSVREEIDTGASGIGFIIWSSAPVKVTDIRVIADKAVVKGSVTVNALYALRSAENADGGCSETEKMTAEIPVSAILDIDGITDSHVAFPELYVTSCELTPSEGSGLISCELLLKCRVIAMKEQPAQIPVDAYSTEYESEFTTAPIKLCADPRSVSKQFSLKSAIDGSELQSVWDCRCELSNITCRPKDSDSLLLSGQLLSRAAGRNAQGVPVIVEKQDAFEQEIPAARVTDNTLCDISAVVSDCGFTMRSDGAIDITAQCELCGRLFEQMTENAISSVTLHEDKPKTRSDDYALRIYYAHGEEDCWSVAKRFNTTALAIMRENDAESEQSALSGMIVIPTI